MAASLPETTRGRDPCSAGQPPSLRAGPPLSIKRRQPAARGAALHELQMRAALRPPLTIGIAAKHQHARPQSKQGCAAAGPGAGPRHLDLAPDTPAARPGGGGGRWCDTRASWPRRCLHQGAALAGKHPAALRLSPRRALPCSTAQARAATSRHVPPPGGSHVSKSNTQASSSRRFMASAPPTCARGRALARARLSRGCSLPRGMPPEGK